MGSSSGGKGGALGGASPAHSPIISSTLSHLSTPRPGHTHLYRVQPREASRGDNCRVHPNAPVLRKGVQPEDVGDPEEVMFQQPEGGNGGRQSGCRWPESLNGVRFVGITHQ